MTSRFFAALVAVFLLGLIGCDAADDATDLDDTNAAVAEAEAVSIVNALAVENGGALASLGEALALGEATRGGSMDFGCERSREYAEDAQKWTQSIDCERGREDGAFYLTFARTREIQFLDATGAPQQYPADAETMLFDIVDGTGIRRTPVFEHVLNDIGGALTVTDFSDDLVTVNGDYARAATDVYSRRRFVRTFDYALDLTFTDIVTPRRMHSDTDHPEGPHGGHGHDRRFWFRAVSGQVVGTLTGTMTIETASGVQTRDIDRSFVVTFGAQDGGNPVARVQVGEYTFEANPTTGEIEGLDS